MFLFISNTVRYALLRIWSTACIWKAPYGVMERQYIKIMQTIKLKVTNPKYKRRVQEDGSCDAVVVEVARNQPLMQSFISCKKPTSESCSSGKQPTSESCSSAKQPTTESCSSVKQQTTESFSSGKQPILNTREACNRRWLWVSHTACSWLW